MTLETFDNLEVRLPYYIMISFSDLKAVLKLVKNYKSNHDRGLFSRRPVTLLIHSVKLVKF